MIIISNIFKEKNFVRDEQFVPKHDFFRIFILLEEMLFFPTATKICSNDNARK